VALLQMVRNEETGSPTKMKKQGEVHFRPGILLPSTLEIIGQAKYTTSTFIDAWTLAVVASVTDTVLVTTCCHICTYVMHIYRATISSLVENRASVPVGFGLQSRLRNRD
jgi:hypothetical protein